MIVHGLGAYSHQWFLLDLELGFWEKVSDHGFDLGLGEFLAVGAKGQGVCDDIQLKGLDWLVLATVGLTELAAEF
jgi:hypothetical protein